MLFWFELCYYWAEEVDHTLWDIQQWSDEEGAEEEVGDEGSLIEDTDHRRIFSLSADLEGEADVETDDE